MLPLILGLSGLELTPDERAFFREAEPAGFILFGRNVRDPAQLRALTDDLRSLTGRDGLPILIDQEGGRVARLGPPHWPAFPPQARFGELYRRAPISGMEAARVNAAAIGAVLAQAGINVACLPLLDLAHDEGHGIVGDRAFGADPLEVASLGRAVLDGLAEAGVAGVIKHMPGHGRARADSHAELPTVTASADELADDLFPFARLAPRARIGMTAHVVYSGLDPQQPATLSAKVIGEVIRGEIGFDGLLLSDDIGMGALSGPIGERGRAALAAGCDLILHCTGDLSEGRMLAGELPLITAVARERLARAIPPLGAETRPKLDALLAKRDGLLALTGDAIG
jgi:beta-N-acetylhexosaminidase